MSSQVPSLLSSHSGFSSYVSLRNPWETIVPSPVKWWYIPLKRLLKELNEIILVKVFSAIFRVKYELKFVKYILCYLLLFCFSKFPQDFFVVVVPYASILLHHLKILIYTWPIYTSRKHQRLHKCLYYICSLTGSNLTLPSDIKHGPRMVV